MSGKYKVNWHSALISGLKIELSDYSDILSFSTELTLNTGPRRIDCLIIKKSNSPPIDSPIASFFKQYNVIDYKGPGESMRVSNFYKALSYVFSLPDYLKLPSHLDDITLTLISHKFPRKLASHFRTKYSKALAKIMPGVYHIDIGILPIQVIILPELPPDRYLWLRCLTNQLNEKTPVRELANAYETHQEDPEYQNFMNAFIHANLISKEGELIMCEALYDLFADKIIENRQEGLRIGKKQGLELGRKQGFKLGQASILSLVSILIAENRNNEIAKITQEPAYCAKLLEEYHL